MPLASLTLPALLASLLLAGCAQPGPSARAPTVAAPATPAYRAPADDAEAARVWEASLRCPNHPQVMGALPYPGAAVAANIVRGSVVIEFAVNSQGQPTRLQVISATSPVFVDTAVQAVQRLRCPAGRAGSSIRTSVEFSNGVN